MSDPTSSAQPPTQTAQAEPPNAFRPVKALGLFGKSSEINVSRAMLLYTVGVLTGLGIAGYGLFTAQNTLTNTVPPEDVALVNQRPILRSDFITQLENETGQNFDRASKIDRLHVLDEMVTEELLVQRGLELDYGETDQDTRNALVAVVNQQILADVTTSQPSDRQLLEYYNQHRTHYATLGKIRVCNLMLPAATGSTAAAVMSTARDAVRALRSGGALDQVLKRFGLVNINKCDDDVYFAAKIHLGDELYELAKGMAAGAISEPVPTADGIHILKLIENTPPVGMSFDTARENVQSDFKMDRETRITDATLKFLRHRAKILIGSDYAADYKP
jgi:parvulin-like peptidyl-prolyl isomerase